MKRLLTVAVGLALCAGATSAEARTNDRTTDGQQRWYLFDSGSTAAPASKRRASQKQRRHATTSQRRRSTRQVSRSHRRTTQRTRTATATAGFLRRGAAGTSRGCLTPAARALLGRIESRFGPVQVVSTCRPGARVAGTGRISRHASGNAIDFKAPNGRKAAIVRWLIANHHSGGTMTYARMSHIHVDIGPRFVSLNAGASYR